jgi:hypothetical protein
VSGKAFRAGESVSWNWSGGKARGKNAETFERTVQRTLKGTKVRRSGSAENPAYLIEQEDGDKVLKLRSELDAG